MNSAKSSLPFENQILKIAAFIFFVIAIILFTTPIGEGDFYWHVKTGQWIWEHLSLPTSDPFSHVTAYATNNEHTARRIPFILKQYWLGQLVMYWVWTIGKEAAMVILRAAIYTSILVMIYQWVKRFAGDFVSLVTIFFIGNELATFSNERPQIFAFLFFVFLLYQLEQISSSEYKFSWKESLKLVGLMMLWGNTHGSYLLGFCTIGIYLFAYLVKHLVAHKTLSGMNRYPLQLIAAMLASGINPNGFMGFRLVFDMNPIYAASIGEYKSPFILATKLHLIDQYYWIPILVTLGVLIYKCRQIELRHTLTLLALAALSTTAVRYVPFFMLTTPLLALNITPIKLKKIPAIIVLAIIIFWGANQSYTHVFTAKNKHAFPEGAMVFLNHTKPAGMLFNPYEWGGYLMLHTGYSVFADGRGLVENFTSLQESVLNGDNWRGIISYFKINTIIAPGTDNMRMLPYRLMWELRNDPEWILVYKDEVAVVFVRNIPENKDIIASYTLPKSKISEHLMERQEWQKVQFE